MGIAKTLTGLVLLGILCDASATLPPQNTEVGSEVSGSDEYRFSCASCHGISGKGDGFLVSILKIRPTDLTTLSKNNDGRFPALRVYQMIDGRESFYAHGDRAMPVWGIRYLLEHAVKYGNINGEEAAQNRIQKLVDYLESIQE